MSPIELWLCGCRVHVDCSTIEFREAVELQFRPAVLSRRDGGESQAHVVVDEDGVRILRGPPVEPLGEPPLLELEWVLNQLCFGLRRGISLHSGCVVWRGQVIVFVAPSEGGKSTMTLAALRAGASYVTDDVLILQAGIGYGLARSIRFKLEPLSQARGHSHLGGMDLDSQILLGGLEPYTAPLYPGPYNTLQCIEFSKHPPAVVVRVSQGESNTIAPLSSLERALILHEAAIAKYAEYDGSLGPGPTFDLTWNDPESSFRLLVEQIESLS